MPSAPLRPDESASLRALRDLDVLDSAPEVEFDALARVASIGCRMPIALISLVDEDRQWFKAHVGLPGLAQTPRDIAFCSHTVLGHEVFEVPDASLDAAFADNPLVTGHPFLRHYAGAPIRLSSGLNVGAVCVLGSSPGRLDPDQRELLICLATAVGRALEARHALRSASNALMGEAALDLGTTHQPAANDPLTGLLNRAAFERSLERALIESQHEGFGHALLFIDLDRFRVVNDACGHAAGDAMLREASRLLSGVVRGTDTVARIGGDEFAVILENCNPVQAQAVAQAICDRLDGYRFSHGPQRFRIGTSIGLVPIDRRWASTALILQAAEASCFAATEAGGSRVHAWAEADTVLDVRHGEMQWATRIEQALDEDRFVLFAQRIEPVGDSVCRRHAEVLIRLVDGDGRLIPPGQFLPAAERFNLAARIDRWVLRRVIAWLKSLPSLDLVETLSVNLSGQSVGDPSFQCWAIEKLADAGQALCRSLCFEITETAAVANMAVAAAFIDKLRAVGVRVALDDFGVGASSFGYLKNFQVDYLKIDGQFIRPLLTDPFSDAAVRCFAAVARVIGVKTVAEFVDDAGVLTRLGEIGIDLAQGYLLHEPEPLDALLAPAVPGLPRPPTAPAPFCRALTMEQAA